MGKQLREEIIKDVTFTNHVKKRAGMQIRNLTK